DNGALQSRTPHAAARTRDWDNCRRVPTATGGRSERDDPLWPTHSNRQRPVLAFRDGGPAGIAEHANASPLTPTAAPQCPEDNGSPGRFDAVQRLFDNAEHAAGRRGESRWTLGHMACLLYVLNIRACWEINR
ncbi:hypothetical protein KUCAC02_034582, partial [Chaenocephalus aceratus]